MTRIYLLWIDKVFFILYFLTFQTLLGSFVQRTSLDNFPSLISAPFPLFCECKDTAFSFQSNTFMKKFSFILNFSAIGCLTRIYKRDFVKALARLCRLRPWKSLFRAVFRRILQQKYHKTENFNEKPIRFRRVLGYRILDRICVFMAAAAHEMIVKSEYKNPTRLFIQWIF